MEQECLFFCGNALCCVLAQRMVCPVFVGRTEELASLEKARRSLAQSQGIVVLLGGEAGIGKSRLLAQFVAGMDRSARQRNVAAAECLEFAERPFGAFRALFAALGGTFPGTEDALVDKREIFERVAAFFRSRSEERATILTIEDVHWADRSTLELLGYLAGRIRGTRLMIVATYRSDELEIREALRTAVSRLVREPSVSRIELGALAPDEVLRLIDESLPDQRECAPAVREQIVKRSEGNPFFAEELLKDACDARPGGGGAVPLSIRSIVRERLASLSSEDRRVVEYAAALGYRFNVELLAIAMETELERVLPSLRRVRDLNVLEEDEDPARFRFRHALTRDVVYASMLTFDARRLHERILSMLETQPDAARDVDALAHHASAAHDALKAAKYNRLAAEAAFALRAFPEARTFQERVLETAERGTTAEADALFALARIAELQGEIEAAARAFDTATARYLALEDFDRASEAMRGVVSARNNLSDPTGIATGCAFLDTYDEQLSPTARDSLLALLARLAWAVFDRDLAARLVLRLSNPESLPAKARQNYYIAQMSECSFRGDVEAWVPYVSRQLALLGELPPFNALIVLNTLAMAASELGARTIAEDALARVREIEGHGDFGSIVTYGCAVRAVHAYRAGRLAEARTEILRAYAGAHVGVAQTLLASVVPHVALALDEPGLVIPLLEEHYAALRLDGTISYDDPPVLEAAAAWQLSRGRAAGARSDLRLVLRSIRRAVPSSFGALVLAAATLDQADLPALRALLHGPFVAGDAVARAGVALANAVLERRFGSGEAAVVLARKAADGYASLHWPIYEKRALEEAGEHEAARAIAMRLGMRSAAGEASVEPRAAGSLSERQQTIAAQIALGASNAEIAERLSISIRTVEKHVASIFEKLGVHKRAQVAALIARSGLR